MCKYMREGKEVLKVNIKDSVKSRADSCATFHFVDGTATTEDDTALIIERVEEWCERIGWVKQGSRFEFAWVPPKTAEAEPSDKSGAEQPPVKKQKRPEPSDKSGAEQPPVKKQYVNLKGPFDEPIGPGPGQEQPVNKQNVSGSFEGKDLKASFERQGPLGTIGIHPGMEYGKKWTKISIVPGDRAFLEEQQRKRLNSSAIAGGSSSAGDIKSMNAHDTGEKYSAAIFPHGRDLTPDEDAGVMMFFALIKSEKSPLGFEYHWTNASEDNKTSGEMMLVSGHIVEMAKGIDWSEDSDKKKLWRMQQAQDEHVRQMTEG